MLLDTGCMQSLIPLELYKDTPEGYRPPLKESAANRVIGFLGETSAVVGMVTLPFSMNNVIWNVDFMVVNGQASPILGMDFFMRNGIVLDFNNMVIWSKEMSLECR